MNKLFELSKDKKTLLKVCDTYIKQAEIPEGIITIGNSAFTQCISLQSIDISNGVTVIGEKAFGFCESLKKINIPNSVTLIGEDIFYGCASLNKINVSKNNPNYTSIDGILFDKELKTIIRYPMNKSEVEYKIPQGVIIIEKDAFMMCASLQNINIPNSVKYICYRPNSI